MKQHLMALAAGLGLWATGSSGAVDGSGLLTDFGAALGPPQAPWRFVGLPNQTKPMTQFRVVTHEGARVLEVKADESYGNLVHEVPGQNSHARTLSWRWRIEQDNPQGDPHKKSGDDHSLAVCAMFDLPLSSLSFGERSLLRAAREQRRRHRVGDAVLHVGRAPAGGHGAREPVHRPRALHGAARTA